jgi:LytS/YehU family sensor histidine kinase
MVSIGMMAIEATEGLIAGYRSVGARTAAPMAPITLQQVNDLMSPRVAAWAVFSFALWLLLLRLYRHRAEAGNQAQLRREAEDSALRARLAPHFIFNALNTLKAQIELAPSEAAATADRLAALFRQVLALTDRPAIPLREELAFVEAYLGIERARLGQRLRVKFEVAEALEAVEVPSLSLQVLVENAVKHGVAPREEGGEVLIWARWNGPGSGRRLLVGVESPAAPEAPATPMGTGTGLQALRGRLERPGDLVIDIRGARYRAEFSCKGLAA